MKTYTVTQKGGYQVLTTFSKQEADEVLEEHEKRSKGSFYICTQGYDDPLDAIQKQGNR